MGILKKRVNDFPTPYTCTRAIREGGLETKLSMMLMGFGNIVHGQKIKGLLYLAVEVAYVVFMVGERDRLSWYAAVSGIGSPGRILGRGTQVYMYTKGDQSSPDPALRSGDRAPDAADVPCMARSSAQRLQGRVPGKRGQTCK